MAVSNEDGTLPEEVANNDLTEQRLMKSIDVLSQFGFTDNLTYQREILRRETFSVSMPKLNCLVGTEYDLNQIMGMHVLYVQKALGLNPLYWTLQDALWLLRKLPKPIRTSETQPPLPMSSDANVDRTSKVPESRLRT